MKLVQVDSALVVLLVRLHLAGFFWGDCSLSNALFRRDAGALQAYVIDVETSERYPTLSEGQRQMDLDIAVGPDGGGVLSVGGSVEASGDWQVLDYDNVARDRTGPTSITFAATVPVGATDAVAWERT